jgi:hypothetical protein
MRPKLADSRFLEECMPYVDLAYARRDNRGRPVETVMADRARELFFEAGSNRVGNRVGNKKICA